MPAAAAQCFAVRFTVLQPGLRVLLDGLTARARRAYRTIKENLIVGVGVVHVMGITADLLGWIGPIQAALLHLGPDVLVFINSIKLLHVRIEAPVNATL